MAIGVFSLLSLAFGAAVVFGLAIFGFRRAPIATAIVALSTLFVGILASVVVWTDVRSEAHQAARRQEMRQVESALRERARRDLFDLPQFDAISAEFTVMPNERLLQTPSEPLPEWIERGTVEEDGRTLVVVSSRQYANRETAWGDAIDQATDIVQWDVDADLGRAPPVRLPDGEPRAYVSTSSRNSSYGFGVAGPFVGGAFNSRSTSEQWPSGGYETDWVLDRSVVSSRAVKEKHTEEIVRSAGDNEFTVYRTYLLVELSPQVRDLIRPIWREQVATSRSIIVAGVIALLTAIAALLSGYYRLDDRTNGRYRWRLRLGTLAAVPLIGAALLTATRLAAHEVSSRPADTRVAETFPSDNRPAQVQPKERFHEIANRMVMAINDADYEGMREHFNERMLSRFPVEECRMFFRERISDKYGKIKSLESPRFLSESVAVYAAHCDRGTLKFSLVLDENGEVAGMLFVPMVEVPVRPIAPPEVVQDCDN